MTIQTHEITLQKRRFKAILLFGALIFVSFMLIPAFQMARSGAWEGIALFAFLIFAEWLFISRAREYLYRDVRLVVESDGEAITFYNTNSAGKVWNKREIRELPKLTRFYTVRTRTRYLMYNYSYAFDGHGWLSGETVDPFPSLYEATEQDRNSVLAFVKMVHPEVALGYESAWSKLTKGK
ncbi:MAG: hypothetical protein JSS76_17365 [Bacteroidetes bacterium]|nr:hypothetical protein [Bacteroidota bacterium]MBS1686511.1 hypothetical protein [Bacteroidota bacterium]